MTDTDGKAIQATIKPYIQAVLGRKAQQIVILDLQDLTSFTDAFIICSGKSNRQVTAIAEHVQIELKKQGKHPIHVEGKKEGHWVLMDYGDVIIHIFFKSVRQFYDLEGLWVDAKRIILKDLA